MITKNDTKYFKSARYLARGVWKTGYVDPVLFVHIRRKMREHFKRIRLIKCTKPSK